MINIKFKTLGANTAKTGYLLGSLPFLAFVGFLFLRSVKPRRALPEDGVIVGRSLDMFISKLREKLEFDPNIKIVVIRGKGYKLEISF